MKCLDGVRYEEVFIPKRAPASEWLSLKMIHQMTDGSVGFVSQNALYRDDYSKLHLSRDDKFRSTRSREFRIRVRRENGEYYVAKYSLAKVYGTGYFSKKLVGCFIPLKIVKSL